jgi:hypothetical protein
LRTDEKADHPICGGILFGDALEVVRQKKKPRARVLGITLEMPWEAVVRDARTYALLVGFPTKCFVSKRSRGRQLRLRPPPAQNLTKSKKLLATRAVALTNSLN